MSKKKNIVNENNTLDSVNDENMEMNELSGGEDAVFEFKRTASDIFATAQKRMKWWSFSNTRLIVYIAFFIVLSVFFAYYAAAKEYLIASFSFIAAAFMLYILLFGHKLLVVAPDADEKNQGAKICCKICNESIYLSVGDENECFTLKEVSQVRKSKKYLLITFKNSRLCPNGIIFEFNGENFDDIKKHLKK